MRTATDPWSFAPDAPVCGRSQAGFSLFQAMLALVVIAAGVGVWLKFWVQDHQVQSVQRQATVLQTARLAGQRLVVHYRDQLLSSAAGTQITLASDGSLLSSPLTPTATSTLAGVTTVSWRFSVTDLVALKLVDASFPSKGVYGSLVGADLQWDLAARTTAAGVGVAASTQVRGTACYNQPLVRDGQPDGLALSTLMAQVTRNVGVVGTGSAATSYQSGAFASTLPADPSQLRWSGGQTGLPAGITPAAGLVCGLVGDWGGADATGRSAFTTVQLGDTCTEPNALAWLSPTGGATPQHIVWCDASQWKLFMGAAVGQACVQGQMAFDASDLRTLWCDPNSLTFVSAYMPTAPQTCNIARDGVLAIEVGTGFPKWCDGTSWRPGLPQLASVTTGVSIGGACTTQGSLGVNSANNLLYCQSGLWVKLN